LFGQENQLKASVEIPKDQLADYLIRARTANPKLRTVVKGDRETEYGVAEDVINILQKVKITRFNLVTNLATGQRASL
jgi:biopolymer transport protein ExbD